jgi:hypothetical protein
VSKRVDCSSHRLPFRGQTYNHDIDFGGVPAKLKLLLAGAIFGLLAAPRQSCVNPLRRGP